jgi:selenocysteine lyase/cysteine desulfurase
MKTVKESKDNSNESYQVSMNEINRLKNRDLIDPFTELEQGVYSALETYSNVHRGSGHNSMVTTHLYEQAREIILDYLGLNKGKYIVIFSSTRGSAILNAQLEPESFQTVSSQDIGLSLGVVALAVEKQALPKGAPKQSGGGTARLMSKEWVVWENAPDRFEPGTPAIVNVIAFAKALRMIRKYGKDIFLNPATDKLTASEILYHDELDKFTGKELMAELRKTLIGSGVKVPTMEGEKPFINLDNSASTPTFTPVWNAFRITLQQSDQVKQDIIKEVKSISAGFLGVPVSEYDLIFTSNTTEAINLASESLSRESEEGIKPVVLNSLLEHSSNDLPWRMLSGYSLVRLSVDYGGFFDLNELEKILGEYNEKEQYGKKRIRLVAVSGASNVLGTCNNLKEISRITHQYGAKLLVDGAQLVAHRKVHIEESGIDFFAFSAHKIYAPFGCGVLVSRKGLLNFNTDEMDMILTSGEENSAGIAALGKSLVLLQRIGMDLIRNEETAVTRHMLLGLKQIPGLKVFGLRDPQSTDFVNKTGVVVFSLKSMMPSELAKELALRSGIGVRFGCHCSHIIIKHLLKVPPFLERFQRLLVTLFPKLRLPGLLRVSLGIENTEEDVDTLIRVLNEIAGKSEIKSELNSSSTKLSREEAQKKMKDFIKAAELRVYS